MKILITGITGQVGTYLSRHLIEHELILSDRKSCDLINAESIKKYIDFHQPDMIINAAAYTNVELANIEFDLAYKINSDAVAVIARKANELNVPVIHFSTDYVFDGKKEIYYENDIPNPLNVYGKSKLKGEDNLINISNNFYIFRTSWVYSNIGKNFLLTILNLAKKEKAIDIVNDQFGVPTSALFLATNIKAILNNLPNNKNEIYHLVPDGSCSWHSFGLKLLSKIIPQYNFNLVKDVKTENFPSKILRPEKTILNNAKVKSRFNLDINTWELEFDNFIGYMDDIGFKL